MESFETRTIAGITCRRRGITGDRSNGWDGTFEWANTDFVDNGESAFLIRPDEGQGTDSAILFMQGVLDYRERMRYR